MRSQGPYGALWGPSAPGSQGPRVPRSQAEDRALSDSPNRRLTRDFGIRPKICFFFCKTEHFHRKNDQEKISYM